MQRLLNRAVRENGSKFFGTCHTCRRFHRRQIGGCCALLHAPLDGTGTEKMCQEHEPT